MFFNDISQISQIAVRTSCTIFVVPPETKLADPHALYLSPNTSKKTPVITTDQIREFCSLASNLETSDRFFVIPAAELMNEPAENALLKTLEEPKPFHHFVLLTEEPHALLPTIRSRSQIFYLRKSSVLDQPPTADSKILTLAKQLISLSNHDLVGFADKISKSKPSPRETALEIIATSIELLYKSYFKTSNLKFLIKLESLLALYDALKNNCHIKLHLVADLL